MESTPAHSTVQAQPHTASILRRFGLLALAELVGAGAVPALVTLSTGCCTLTLTLQPGLACAAPEAPPAMAAATPDRARRPTLRDRILAVLTDRPSKLVQLAHRCGHPCDSYFREQCADLQRAGKMVRDELGGFRRPRPDGEGGAQ